MLDKSALNEESAAGWRRAPAGAADAAGTPGSDPAASGAATPARVVPGHAVSGQVISGQVISGELNSGELISTDVLFLRRMIQEARNDLKRSRDQNLELVKAIRTVCERLDGLAEQYRESGAA